MKKFRDILTVIVIVNVIVAMLTSCVNEELCELSHPHTSTVTFDYDWSNVENLGITRPDSMFILFDRVVYQEMFSVKRDSWTGTGHYISVPDSASAEQRAQLTGDYSQYTVNSAYYKFMTVNGSSEVFDTSELQKYFSSQSNEVQPNLVLPYKTYKSSEIAIGTDTTWPDYNDYTHSDGTQASFIHSDVEAIAIDSTEVMEIAQGSTVNVSLAPTILTHSIDMYFDIKKDVSQTLFTIDSVYVVISGVPEKISIPSGALDISKTDKLLEKFRLVSPLTVPTTSSAEMLDTETNRLVRCYRNLNITGIVENNNMDTKKCNGPGVLQLIVFCNVQGDDGEWKTKTINGLVNIHNALEAAGLQVYSYEKDCYIKSSDYTRLPININFTITRQLLIGDESEGIPEWEDGGIINEDI